MKQGFRRRLVKLEEELAASLQAEIIIGLRWLTAEDTKRGRVRYAP
jgi:hypothetical protein